ncbi:MAG TPA: RHS repeat-associated core domain-containing protein [Thermoanaerobaculia bacterium]|jgi:RHS repeat-associated protein|nr:RHS repeat-associated core domain-containing protein [Thermoanaerobaculia bacterium]
MRRVLLALLLAFAPVLLAEDVPQAVKALQHLKPRTDVGPFSWTAGEYRYDGAGDIVAIGNEAFVYDKLGRLESATVRGPDLSSFQTQTFSYDDYGNLIATTKLGQSVQLSVDVATNRLTALGYDASGNVILSGTQHCDYDAAGMLNTLLIGNNLQPRIIYVYTADDERLFAFDVSTGITHWTLRGFDNKVLRDFRQQGNTWSVDRDYVYRDGLLLAALKSGGAIEHYTLDHLGTPRLITDGSGRKVGYHAYWPYGEEWTPANAQEGSPLQFTGHERDADPSNGAAGLDSLHARYYRAGWGRFLGVDTVLGTAGQPQSWNRYTYAENNPILKVDPDGRQAVVPAPGAGPAGIPLSLALYHVTQMNTNAAYRDAAVGFVSRNVALAGIVGKALFGMVVQSTLPAMMAKKRDDAKSGAVPGENVDPNRARQLGERAKQGGSVADAMDQLDAIQDRQTKIRQGKASGIVDSTGKSDQRFKDALNKIGDLKDALADQAGAEPPPEEEQNPPEVFR